MKKDTKDIIGEKCIQDDSGKLASSDEEKKARKHHLKRPFNGEFPWC